MTTWLSLALPWYRRRAAEASVHMCISAPLYFRVPSSCFFACAIPLSFPLLCLHCLFDPSAFNCSITCPFLNLPCCPPELIVPFSGHLKVIKCTSKDLPATLQFTKGFHSSDFIWFLKEHSILIITHVMEHQVFYLLFFNPQDRFIIIVEEAEANSE